MWVVKCYVTFINNKKTLKMSRIGKQPIVIPEGTMEVTSSNEVTVKGKLGELSLQVTEPITVRVEESVVTLERPNDQKESRSKHGVYALINNMIEGVSKGYTKELELVVVTVQLIKDNNQNLV